MAADAAGNVWVADGNNSRIQEFNSNGAFLRSVGYSWGSGNGQFNFPQDVTVDAQGFVWVADTNNHRIQKFDGNGNYLDQFALSFGPESVAVDPSGNIWIANLDGNTLVEYSSVPEPSSILLLGIGAIGLLGYARRRYRI